jgi:phosphatidate cytidylyltransferase
MTADAASPAPQKDYGRAGRNLPAAVGSAVVLLVAIAGSLFFFKSAFMLIVAAAVVVAVWELHRGLAARGIDIPEQPLMAGGVVMVAVAYFWGAPALVTATAVTALVVMLWLLRRGVEGFVQNASAAVFTLVYVPFLGSFVALMLAEGGPWDNTDHFDDGVRGIITFILVTIASDIGGYVAGVLFGKHPMAPAISPKKSWEGLGGSLVFGIAVSVLAVEFLLEKPWWVGIPLGIMLVITGTLGDLIESQVKRDLGIKDMGTLLPGHGGLMDRLDSVLPSAVATWIVLTLLA